MVLANMECQMCSARGGQWCPGGCQYIYCSDKCRSQHWDEGHQHECAKLDKHGITQRFVWAGRNFDQDVRKYTRNMRKYANGDLLLDYNKSRLPDPVSVDCSVFVQMLHYFHDAEDKHTLRVGVEITKPLYSMKLDGMPVTLVRPKDLKIAATITRQTPCGAEWVIGPDADGKYLGCGMKGPVRKTGPEWCEFLMFNLKKDAENMKNETLQKAAQAIEESGGFIVQPPLAESRHEGKS